LFRPIDSEAATIDDDKNRGAVLKIADEDKDWNLETHEYNKHKETIADAFLRSKQEYFAEMQDQENKYNNYDPEKKNSIQWSTRSTCFVKKYNILYEFYEYSS